MSEGRPLALWHLEYWCLSPLLRDSDEIVIIAVLDFSKLASMGAKKLGSPKGNTYPAWLWLGMAQTAAAQQESNMAPISENIPATLSPLVEGRRFWPITSGLSGSSVWRLDSNDPNDTLYLKHSNSRARNELEAEMLRLNWLAGRFPAPEVFGFCRTDAGAWLLSGAAPGRPASELLENPSVDPVPVVVAIGEALRCLHSLAGRSCPFNSTVNVRMAQAQAALREGRVAVEDFDEARRGQSADQLWNALTASVPASEDFVVTHGDATFENFLIDDAGKVYCIDVSRLGVADRYQDVALMLRELAACRADLVEPFLRAYGISSPDWDKVEFYQLLDEFF